MLDNRIINNLIHSFARTTEDILTLAEFKKLLVAGRQLRMKFGVDVTAPDLHIGHAVNLWMYRKLQELGHKIIFLVGDFTTQIGDPTGKSRTRPIIPLKEIEKNAKSFIRQAMMVLLNDPRLVEVRYNSEWYDKMRAKELIYLMSMITHDRLIGRDMFRKRMREGKEVYEHELVYPILQGYDSVMLNTDLTIVGLDQLFNEALGRFYQGKFGQPSQVIITTRITPGIDGKEKQSKSLGNFIGLDHSPREKFGRIMSMPDKLIIDYFKVYTEVSLKEVAQIEKDLKNTPLKYKLRLAKKIVARYHGPKVAEEELLWWQKTFSKKEAPEDLPVISLKKKSANIFEILREAFPPKEKSNSEIRRLIAQHAVSVNNQTVQSPTQNIRLGDTGVIVLVGKRTWFKIEH